jgi:type II secretory pathway pseudopilin PulG
MARSLILLALVVIAGACLLALWRLSRSRRRRGNWRQRENTLPYELWYALRQKDTAAADRMLAGLWEQQRAERAQAGGGTGTGSGAGEQSVLEAQIGEVAGAVEALRRAHAGEAALPPALDALEERVRRLCGDVAALEGGGTS